MAKQVSPGVLALRKVVDDVPGEPGSWYRS